MHTLCTHYAHPMHTPCAHTTSTHALCTLRQRKVLLKGYAKRAAAWASRSFFPVAPAPMLLPYAPTACVVLPWRRAQPAPMLIHPYGATPLGLPEVP
eukprot:1689967-Rhodomonas_salina.1